MNRFTMGDILSTEEIEIIKYYLDIAAGVRGLDDSGSGEEESEEFNQHTQPLVS